MPQNSDQTDVWRGFLAALMLVVIVASSTTLSRAEENSATGELQGERSCSFHSFGAKGGVVPDDTEAIQTAIASGCPLLDGENVTYRVIRTSTLANVHGLTIQNATFIDSVPVEKWNRGVLA